MQSEDGEGEVKESRHGRWTFNSGFFVGGRVIGGIVCFLFYSK